MRTSNTRSPGSQRTNLLGKLSTHLKTSVISSSQAALRFSAKLPIGFKPANLTSLFQWANHGLMGYLHLCSNSRMLNRKHKTNSAEHSRFKAPHVNQACTSAGTGGRKGNIGSPNRQRGAIMHGASERAWLPTFSPKISIIKFVNPLIMIG